MADRTMYHRAVEVFLEVVDLQGESRTWALERACAGDPALRREVDSLLVYHDQGGPRRNACLPPSDASSN
jgi:hypothetical protein